MSDKIYNEDLGCEPINPARSDFNITDSLNVGERDPNKSYSPDVPFDQDDIDHMVIINSATLYLNSEIEISDDLDTGSDQYPSDISYRRSAADWLHQVANDSSDSAREIVGAPYGRHDRMAAIQHLGAKIVHKLATRIDLKG